MAAGIVSPVLVGRLGELSVLVRARERSATGEPGVVLVGGEAGVGKTRLVQEASALAESAGARVLTGACVELGGDRLPLAPLVDALRALARSSPEAELGALLGPARRDLARLLPELDPAAAAPDGETETSPTSQLVEIVLGLVERLAIERPLVLVLEDLHWADRATLELVEFLVRALRGVRVLLVGTYRSDELHRQHPLRSLLSGWNRVRSVERVELDRFDRDEVATQVAAILGAPPSSRLVELVLARSEGNAFLVEEIVRAVQNGADPGYLPPSLRDMLLVRAERLSDPAQRVLQTVAVAGRWVPDRLLAAVTAIGAHEQEADAQLTLGVARAYLGDAEAGLAALSAGLELALGNEDHETALRGYVNLSDSLEMVGRHEEAAAAARAGMALAERVGQARTFGAYLSGNLVEPLLRLGHWDEAARVLDDALRREPEGIFAAWLLELRACLAVHTGDLDTAEADVARVRALIRDEDEQYLEGLAFVEAEAARMRGDLAAAASAVADGLEAARGSSERYAWPLIWSGVRIEADLAGRARRSQETKPDDARKRIAALTRRAADLPAETTRARSYRQLVDTEQARAAGAEADWPAAVAAWRTAGEPHMLAYALMRLAAALVATGNREEATRAADEAARHARALGAQPLLSEVLDLGRRARLGVEARGGPEAAELDGPLASYGLTDREREVLQLVADGRSNSEIGAALFITRKTASVHVSNILAKIGVASRGEAAALVHRLGGALLGTGPLP